MNIHRLVLIRHAKTERGHRDGDHARELIDRGVADSRAAGEWLLEESGRPDLALVSSAARAQQTWQEMTHGTRLAEVEVWSDRRIYNADPEELLAVVSEVPEDYGTVVLVGHAPGVPDLAADLADTARSDPDAVAELQAGFPTMACAVVEVPTEWADLAVGGAELSLVHTPRAEGPSQ